MTATPRRIHVVDYDPAWVDQFTTLRDHVWPKVHDAALRIEHVGSTSVPGLAAKPVIDVDIVVASTEQLDICIERLAELGAVHRGELGIAGRHAFTRIEHLPTHNLYVCLEGTLGLRNHLILRNYLLQNPNEARAYGILKKRLAATHTYDIEAYVEGKTSFIVEILKRVGVEGESLDEIVLSNKAST